MEWWMKILLHKIEVIPQISNKKSLIKTGEHSEIKKMELLLSKFYKTKAIFLYKKYVIWITIWYWKSFILNCIICCMHIGKNSIFRSWSTLTRALKNHKLVMKNMQVNSLNYFGKNEWSACSKQLLFLCWKSLFYIALLLSQVMNEKYSFKGITFKFIISQNMAHMEMKTVCDRYL